MQGIFINALRHILDPEDKSAERKPFDIKFETLEGETVSGCAVCTSSNFKNDTFNFKFIESSEFRTVHASLLLSINQIPVML